MENQEYKFCTQCGAKMPKEARFCTSCGSAFKLEEANKAVEPKKTETVQSVSALVQPTAAMDDKERVIIRNNTEYYQRQFEDIRRGGKGKMNWASFFLNLYHAAYRNVWKEWLKDTGKFMFAAYAVMAAGSLIFLGLCFFTDLVAAGRMIFFAGLGIGGVLGVIYVVKQILFSMKFNKVYLDHVEKKKQAGDSSSDPSVGRAVLVVVVMSVITGILAAIAGTSVSLASLSALVSSEIEDGNDYYIGNDIPDFSTDFSADSPGITAPADRVSGQQIQAEDIFVSYPDEVSWFNPNGYYMIPYSEDGEEIVMFCTENDMANSAQAYYLEVENTEATSNGGLKVTGTMYGSAKTEKISNGEFTVTWDSYESIDYASVALKNSVIDTDTSMTGEYSYYGPVGMDEVETDTVVSEPADSEEYIIPGSDSRYLTDADVEGLDLDQIRFAINEIYARHGRAFQTEDLNEYFSSKSWYTPLYSADEFAAIEDSVMNDYEKENIKFLAAIRDNANGSVSSQFEAGWIYGTYETHDGGIDASAEIGWYSDTGEDYISLSGATSDGRSLAEFTGTVVSSNGNSYTAVDENGDVIDFTYNGVDAIEITNGYVSDGGLYFPGFEGIYQKTADLSHNVS